jgi:hypothetical protein
MVNMASYPISSATVFIQIWVDTNSVQGGQTTGIYLADNRVSSGSQNEGSASLQTSCTKSSIIAWQIFAIDPNFEGAGGSLQISQIGNSNAWGQSGQPESLNTNTWTGQAQNAGQASYQISINVALPGQNGISTNVNPSINVTT